MKVSFTIAGVKPDENKELEVMVRDLLVIGYSGRNMEKTKEHIIELQEKLGVEPPKRIPTIFHCAETILSQEDSIRVVGEKTSGEIEYVMIFSGGELYITVGSDHTDRELEGSDVFKAKEICAKPVAKVAWRYEEIKDHMDAIEVRSWQETDGALVEYQSGKLCDILPVEMLKAELDERVGKQEDAVVFCGTVPIMGEFIFGDLFKAEMYDPVLNRTIACTYKVSVLTEL